jgi:S-adenosyl-L-methionine hydrolase (adenosine-forming)
MPLLTFLSDFGTSDYYVSAVKGTVLRLAPSPSLQIVDLSHEVAPGDIEGAADLLAATTPSFPSETLHLAVVDPGVGTRRRILIAEAGGHRFLAPDNGLLTWVLEGAGCAGWQAWVVTREDLFLDAPGATFHGRDRFAPLAAALLRGETPGQLGERVADPVLLELPTPQRLRDDAGTVFRGRVRRVDRFGNLVTDLPVEWLRERESPRPPVVEVAGRRIRSWVSCYAELSPREPGALVGSLGTIELFLRGESLAERWKVGRGAVVRVVQGIEPR